MLLMVSLQYWLPSHCRLLHADIRLMAEQRLFNRQTPQLPSASWSGHLCELLVSHIWQQHWYVFHSKNMRAVSHELQGSDYFRYKRAVSFAGSLKFLTKSAGGGETLVWLRSGTQGNKWRYADLSFHTEQPIQVRIAAVLFLFLL